MTPDPRWQEIERLLDELLDLTPDDRRRRLDALTGDAASLRPQLERLLAADAVDEGLLERGVGAVVSKVVEDGETTAGPGARIGPYRVVRELGRGGMGEVFLAERALGDFEQQVALKIVRGGRKRADVIARFHRERSILARLRHPNVAALHDGGTTDDGAPWFAMEYVEGERITDYCNARRLSLEARIVLFRSVCHAVEYAHRNLVVHRDIKPGNVFVTVDGTAKLLDFGIGKLLGADDAEATQTAHGFLTPAFAAPEQILGEATSTATDVFSLGMLLYVLLTGHHPHGDTSRSAELARAIVEEDPPVPSALVTTARANVDESAALRGVTALQLRRQLRGDLDNILGKALRKDPEERYASVAELREDLDRHLHALPVHARPATRRYRIRKFVRRHFAATVAGVVTGVAILAGVAGVTWQAKQAARERDRARVVKDYLLEVFSAVDPSFESGESLSAAELVERGAARIDERFRDAPEIRAEISGGLGAVLGELARYDAANAALTAALRDYRRLGDLEGAYRTLRALGSTALWQGDGEKAWAHYEEALVLARREFGPDDPRAISVIQDLGGVAQNLGKNERAGELFREALHRAQQVFGERDVAVAPYHSGLATYLQDVPDLAGAEAELRTAIRVYRDAGARGVPLANTLHLLGHVLQLEDRSAEAEAVLRDAVAVLREEYGREGHPLLANALNTLAGPLMQGNLAEASGPERLAEAERCVREAMDIFVRTLGPDHWMVAKSYSDLSVVKSKQGDIVEAGNLLAESVRILKIALGDRHPALGAPLSNLARSYLNQDRYDEAERTYDEAIAMAREVFGEQHVHVSHPLQGYAELCAEIGRYADATRAATEAWEIRREALGDDHSLVVETRVLIGEIQAQAGEHSAARRTLDAAIADARAGLPLTRTVLASALVARAERSVEAREEPRVAEALLAEALAIRETEYGADDARCIELREQLAAVRAGGR